MTGSLCRVLIRASLFVNSRRFGACVFTSFYGLFTTAATLRGFVGVWALFTLIFCGVGNLGGLFKNDVAMGDVGRSPFATSIGYTSWGSIDG